MSRDEKVMLVLGLACGFALGLLVSAVLLSFVRLFLA